MREIALHVLDVLQNAAEAGATRVELTIDEDQPGDRLTITLHDNGRGMDAATLAQVTNPFFTTRTTRHVGLGLPLFAAAAERAGGQLVVESEPGQGTRVLATFGYFHPDRQPLGDLAGYTVGLLAFAARQTCITSIGWMKTRLTLTRRISGRPLATSRSRTPPSVGGWPASCRKVRRRWRRPVGRSRSDSDRSIWMPKLKTLEDLKRVREEAQQSLKVRMDTGTTITVGMGTCGIAAGARETMHAILEELAKREIDAHVTTVGCIGMCVKEPLVDIEQAGQAAITYANVKPEMVPRLIEEHLVKGQPVEEWVIGRMQAPAKAVSGIAMDYSSNSVESILKRAIVLEEEAATMYAAAAERCQERRPCASGWRRWPSRSAGTRPGWRRCSPATCAGPSAGRRPSR